jgi:hypothetical protein
MIFAGSGREDVVGRGAETERTNPRNGRRGEL